MARLIDIANELDVSVSVVSRALSPDIHTRISDATRQRVIQTARRLGFRRNRVAEFLVAGKTATIGAFLPDTPNKLVADMMFGMSEAAMRLGFPLTFFAGGTVEKFEQFLAESRDAALSGVIVYPFGSYLEENVRPLLQQFQEAGGKLAVISATEQESSIVSVSVDDYIGGRLAAEHLVARKCDAFLIDRGWPSQRRSEGCVGFLAEHGYKATLLGLDRFAEALDAQIVAGARRIGVFAVADQYAVGLLPVLRDRGLTVGKDVLLVGYDDLDFAEFCDPPLTTICQPFRELGRQAVETLVNVIYGKGPESRLIPPRLIVRKTT